MALATAGVISIASVVHAEEAASQVMTALSSTTLSGYVSTSALWKPGTGNANLPGRAFDGVSKLDGFNLDVVSLTISKPLAEGDWSAGYTTQLWLGPDAVGFNTSFPNATGAGGDLAVKQAFVTLRAPIGNGLTFTIGHFNYIGGYEVPDSGDDVNFSRSYAWQLEPASHTGILASYKVSDALSLAGGVANTYNNGVNWRSALVPAAGGAIVPAAESRKTYMGQFSLTAPESFGALKGATLSGTVVSGLNSASGNAGSLVTPANIVCYQIGGTVPTPLKSLSFGWSYDYIDRPPLPAAVVQGKSAYANAADVYVLYQATDKLKLNTRAEYTSGTAGTWYAPAAGRVHPHNELFGLTETIDYALWANVVSRFEVRWDHSMTGDKPFGGTIPGVGVNKNALTLALNVIYKF